MVKVEFKQGLKLKDLAVGKMFEDELIMGVWRNCCMQTIIQGGDDGEGGEIGMTLHVYDFKHMDGEITEIDYNGKNEIFTWQPEHNYFKETLKKHNLWDEQNVN